MISRCAKFIVIWEKPNGVIYHKFVSGHYCSYYVGYVNQYNHEIIYIINVNINNYKRPPLKLRFKRKLINYINKM